MLANEIQHCVKRIICHAQVGCITSLQGWFDTQKSISIIHNIDRLKKKNHMIISGLKESIWHCSIPIHGKKKKKNLLVK